MLPSRLEAFQVPGPYILIYAKRSSFVRYVDGANYQRTPCDAQLRSIKSRSMCKRVRPQMLLMLPDNVQPGGRDPLLTATRCALPPSLTWRT